MQNQDFFNNMPYVRNVHLTKSQAYSQQTNSSSVQRGCYVRINTARVQLGEKISGRDTQGAIDGKRNWLAANSQS
jgi:hypothetical protein